MAVNFRKYRRTINPNSKRNAVMQKLLTTLSIALFVCALGIGHAQAQTSYINQLYVGFGSVAAANAANGNGSAQNLTATGNLGIWESGVYGNINDFNSKWMGMGKPSFPGANVYGLRTQWKKDLAIFNLRGNNGDNDRRDLAILWGTNSQNRLKFEFVGDPATQAVSTEVMTMLSNGRVGINTNSPFAQLDVRGNNTTSYGGYLQGRFIGAYGRGLNPNSFGSSYGTVGISTGGSFRIGIYGYAAPFGGGTSYAGYFNGDVLVSGNFINLSDKNLKSNIAAEEGALEKVLQLKPSTYVFNADVESGLKKPTELQHGFIAQDLELIFPELVKEVAAPAVDKDGVPIDGGENTSYKAVDYVGVISILTAALQEQQQQINQLSSSISRQSNLIEEQNAEIKTLRKAAGVPEPAGLGKAELYQNAPNPFSSNSEIRFFLPETASQATLYIYDMQGSQIKRFDISERGESAVLIDGNDLQAGMYIYSLIVDGREIDAKRMVLTR